MWAVLRVPSSHRSAKGLRRPGPPDASDTDVWRPARTRSVPAAPSVSRRNPERRPGGRGVPVRSTVNVVVLLVLRTHGTPPRCQPAIHSDKGVSGRVTGIRKRDVRDRPSRNPSHHWRLGSGQGGLDQDRGGPRGRGPEGRLYIQFGLDGATPVTRPVSEHPRGSPSLQPVLGCPSYESSFSTGVRPATGLEN